MRETRVPAVLQDYFNSSPLALSLGAATGDNALLLINRRFRELTGYGNREVVGRNCRFLQGTCVTQEAHKKIHGFMSGDEGASVRTSIVNFRKDGTPFVNLLFMSKLCALSGEVRYIFASQFDISHTQPHELAQYDADLGDALRELNPVLAQTGLIVEQALAPIANAAATIAQAKLTLAELDEGSFV